MKRILILYWFALFMSSCVKEADQDRTEDNLVQSLTSGTWEISFLALNGIDRGKEFVGINFLFLPNGQVEAFRGTQLLGQGLWSTRVDSGIIEIQISFSSNPKFENLNAIWSQYSVSFNRITLRKIESGPEDFLVFVKR